MNDPISEFLSEETMVKAVDRLEQAELTPEASAILAGAQLIADAIDAHTTNEEFFHEKLMECIDNAAEHIGAQLEKIYGEVGS